jgi:N-carbamoylputrescine amidase
MSRLVVAAAQFACATDLETNLATAEKMVRAAAAQGARFVQLPELFATRYFCIEQDPDYFSLAHALEDDPSVQLGRRLARELDVVLPISFFERAGQNFFNTVAMIDAGGEVLGRYRKAHIPSGPGYQEKHYFTPGDTGFKVWSTRVGRVGVGICWDQWFPECARAMTLAGAELLSYPTAIGSEPPPAAPVDSFGHWQRVQQGHAAANLVPLLAANRHGREASRQNPRELLIDFHGGSFIADASGAIVAQAARDADALLCAEFDLEALARARAAWGVFRDRRPDIYGALVRYDGGNPLR